MLCSIQVEIDPEGHVRPVQPGVVFPAGHAMLIVEQREPNEAALLAEPSLAREWLRPEEDEAWAHL